MTTEPNKRWTRRLLAVVDGVLFGWFLLIAHYAAGNLIQISEFVWHPKPEDLQPRLTLWVQYIFPEETWSMLSGILAFSLGFALISLTSNEALPSRLCRWTFTVVITVLFALSLPAMSAFKNLISNADKLKSDEVLFVALALALLVYGIIRWRRFQQPQA
ncbi:hypothetical protein [Prosthecobacter sp.]|uniref:hypothetical protein n=1 Tax=Prosthecobacter sp. TaxID=1965333 RepID=UPI003783A271